MKLAVMQGRLSPPEGGRIQCFPRESWREEFARAAKAGIPGIEWIDDTYGARMNPLRNAEGLAELRSLMDRHGIAIPSVCADSFMEQPLVRCTAAELDERLALLEFLFRQAHHLGARHIGIPLLDHSVLTGPREITEAAAALTRVVPVLEELSMELHLESSLSASEFPMLLQKLPHPLIRVTYDTGNSASLGFDPQEEFSSYGDRIGSVHIKDRKRGGGTVKLGSGDTNFAAVAAELRNIRFTGLFTLQAARGEEGRETALLREYTEFAQEAFGAF